MTDEQRERLRARREHSKGDGKFPRPERPRDLAGESARDRLPEDLPKDRDPRDAPQGNETAGQREGDPGKDLRR